jgi:hypothetical protein
VERIDLRAALAVVLEADFDCEPHQRMAHVDDLFQRRPEQLPLTIIPRLRHRRLRAENPPGIESEIGGFRNPKSQENPVQYRAFLQNPLLAAS